MSRTEPGTTTLASSKLRMTFDGQGPEARLGRLDTHGARQEVAMGPTSVRLWMLKPAQRK